MAISFTCPHCRAHLKIRDDSEIGQPIECPECRLQLLTVKLPNGEVIGRDVREENAESAKSSPTKPRPTQRHIQQPTDSAPESRIDNSSRLPATIRGFRTSQVAAWSFAGLFLLGLIVILLVLDPPLKNPDASYPVEPAATPTAATRKADTSLSDSGVGDSSVAPHRTSKTVENKDDLPLSDTPEGRLEALGKLLREKAARDGFFPAGTVRAVDLQLAHRWSWLAAIAAGHDNSSGLRIDWNQRWNDPATDRFVRRAIPRFQNPQAEVQTSEDKYPAGHYVGVAGVGADAPTLPGNHPRAGIFGQDRQTRLDEIGDGLSNTMLLAGIESNPGSWAEGLSSYRPFTREPYIHGPDGFGTGQPKSMFVLMADGSVRQISQETEGTVVRRMAAMNDGLPLDPSVPGEPSETRSASSSPLIAAPKAVEPKAPNTTITVAPKPDKLPDQVLPTPMPKVPDVPTVPMPPVAAPEVVLDIPAALRRKILSFDQVKPAAAYQLLLQIEQLSGVRIEYDRQALGDLAPRLDKPISLKMKNASLEQLLHEILSQIQLKRKDEKSRIQIVAPD